MANVPLSTDVPRIYPPSFSVPEISKARIYRAEIDVPGKSIVQPNITRRRDHADDLGDLILGHPISGTRELRNLLDDNDVGAIGSIPLLNRIVGAGLLIKERALDPIAEGDIDVALVNSLETFGKSLDILANPVKSLMPWAGGGSSTDLLKSMGWLDGAYREEYQWDTGNFLVDLAGEIVSDPLTLASFGLSAAAKTPTKIVTEATQTVLTKNLSKTIVDNLPTALKQDIVLKASSGIINESSDVVKTLFDDVAEQYTKLKNLLKSSPELVRQPQVQELLQVYKRTLTKKGREQLINALADLRYTKAFRQYNAINSWRSAVNTLDKGLTTASLSITPLAGAGYAATKYMVIPGFKHLWNKAVKQLKEIDSIKFLNNNSGALKEISDSITLNNAKLHKSTLDKFGNLLDSYDYDLNKLQNIWRSLYRKQGASATVENTNKMFLNKLKSEMPLLKNVNVFSRNKEQVNALIKEITPNDVTDLVNVVSQGGVVLINVEDTLLKQYKEVIEKQMEYYFTDKGKIIQAGTPYENYTMRQQLEYINNRLLTYNGVRYGLKNLDKYLEAINTNTELYANTVSLLNYTGITLDNYKEVYRLVRSKTKEANKQLKELLLKSKTGTLYNIVESKTALSKSLNYAKYTMPDIPLTVTTDMDKAIIDFFNKTSPKYTKEIVEDISKVPDIKTVYEFKDSLNKTLESYISERVLKPGSKKEYMFIVNPNKLEQVYRVLDSLYTNTDSDLLEYSNSTILKNVLEFEVDTTIKEESLKLFKENLQELRQRSYGWVMKARQDATFPAEDLALLEDLYGTLSSNTTSKTIVDLADMLMEGKTYVRLISSAQNRYAQINSAIAISDILPYYKELSDIDNPVRVNLQEVVRKLDSIKGTTYYSRYINNILAKIDSNNAIASLLNKSMYDYDLPADVRRYTQGLFLNILYENKDKSFAELKNKISELTDRYMNQFTKDNGAIVHDYFINNAISADVDTVQFLEDLRTSVNYAFTEYLNRLESISKVTGVDVKMYNVFDDEAVSYMNQLAVSYPEIIEALNKAQADDVLILETRKFIENLAGNRIEQVKSEFVSYLEQLKAESLISDKTMSDLTDTLMDVPYKTLSNSLVTAFRNIDQIMDDLAGADGVLANVISNGRYSEKLKNVVKYVSVDELNEFLRTTSKYNNMYSASTASGVLGFRKELDSETAALLNLNQRSVVADDSQTYLIWYTSLTNSYKRAKRTMFIDNEYLENIRYSLIDMYSNYTVPFRPKDPANYFLEADKYNLLAWHITTSSPLVSINNATSYQNLLQKRIKAKPSKAINTPVKTYSEKVDYYSDPSKVFTDIDTAVSKAPLMDADRIAELHDEIPTINLPDLYSGIDTSFKTRLKDVKSLKMYESWFSEKISNDVTALDRIKVLDTLKEDKKTVASVIKNKQDLITLASYNITGKTAMSDNRVLRFMIKERVNALNKSIKSWNAKQLYSFISDNTEGFMIYVDDTGSFKFNYTPEELKEAGLIISNLADDENIYVVRKISNDYSKVPYTYIKPRYIFKEQQDIITNLFKQNRNYIYWDGMTLPDELFTGNLLDYTDYSVIKTHPSIQKIIGDNAGQKLYSNFTKEGLSNFYIKSIRPDVAIVGSDSAYNTVLDLCKNEFAARNMSPRYLSSDITKRAWKGMFSSIQRVNSMNKYLQLFMNDDFALGGSVFKPILSKASDDEIADLFKRNSYTAAIIRSDRKGRPHVYKIFVENKKQLQDAIEAKAVILPHEVYRNAVLSINKQQLDNKLINLYRRTIVGTYKSIYLTSPGFLVRNYLDSAVYRNNAEYQGLVGMFDMFKYEAKASKMLDWYNSIHKEVFNLAKGKTFNRKNLRRVLANLTEEQRQTYFTIDMFMNSSASGGLSQEFEKFLLSYNKANSESLTYAWAQYWNENVIDNPIFRAVRETNNKIEQSSRFGLFLALLDQDLGYSEAIRRVINTHFDYELKENGLDILEQIFWFSTFPINNTLYFINDGLTRNPDMLKSYMDALELSYNDSDNYTWDDVRNSDYLTYNALTGNIRFYLFGNDSDDPTSRLLLKTGSSVLDFFNIIANPLGEATERINPFLSVLLGITPPNDLNPFNAYGSKVENIVTGRSYIPSVYATLYPVYRKENKYKIPKRPYVKSNWTGIRKPRTIYPKRPKSQKYMSYRFSTDKYYFYQKENIHRWRITTRNKIPHTYNETNQTLTPIGRYTYDNKKFARAVKKLRMPQN